MSGCAVCVYDLYFEAMGSYREEMEGVKRRLGEMGVNGSEWPVALRAAESEAAEGKRTGSVVVEAFEQLERELARRGH
jgi:hypothetical protein